MTRAWRFAAAVGIGAGLLAGAPAARAATSDTATPAPTVAMLRTGAPPEIDGRLDDPVWADAAVIANLTQVEPEEGVAPTQATEVRLLYDSDFLYLGIRAFDSEPDKIIATELERDSKLESDDPPTQSWRTRVPTTG